MLKTAPLNRPVDSIEVGLMPRYELGAVRRTIIGIGQRLGVPPQAGARWARRLIRIEALGRSQEGLAALPNELDRLAEGLIDPGEEPSVTPLPNREGVRIASRRGLPSLVLDRAAELAAQLARGRPVDGVGLVRISGLEIGQSAAAEVVDLALGPFEAASRDARGHRIAAWPTDLGFPLLLVSAGFGERAESDNPSPPELPPIPGQLDGDEVVIVARAIQPGKELARAHERIIPSLRAAEGDGASGYRHPESLRRRRDQALAQGISLPGAVAAELAEWARRLKVPPLTPIDESEARLSW